MTNIKFDIDKCNKIIDLYTSNQNDFEKQFYILLQEFQNNYSSNTKYIEDEDNFRNKSKEIFYILHNTMNFEDDTDWDEIEEEDKNTFLKFKEDLNYVYNHIDTVNFKEPHNEYIEKSNNVINYMKKIKENLTDLTNTVNEMNESLKNLDIALNKLIK